MAEWHTNNPGQGKMPRKVEEIAMLVDLGDEDKKAVAALLRKHKAPGTVAEWLPAYETELNTVLEKRCKELEVVRDYCGMAEA